MNKFVHHILVLAFVSACVISCGKVETERSGVVDIPIGIGASGIESKSLMNSSDFLRNGTSLKVYDILSGFSGTMDGVEYSNSGNISYIADEVVYNGSSPWSYKTDGAYYPWTSNGMHRFFGYLSADPDGLSVSDVYHPSYDAGVLNLGTTFNSTSTQLDFVYSTPVVRDASSGDYSTVPLQMRHLFSAISMAIMNKSEQEISIKQVTVGGFRNKNSASINFLDSSNPLTLGEGEKDGPFFEFAPSSPSSISTDGTLTLFDHLLCWPLSEAGVADGTVRVVYTVAGVYAEDGVSLEEFDVQLALSGAPWMAGRKNSYTLLFRPKAIELKCNVLPWSYSQHTLNFADATVTVPAVLSFDDQTYASRSGNTFYTATGSSYIAAQFQITNPVGAKIHIVPSNTDYFSISMDRDIVDPAYESGKINFKIHINPDNLPKTGQVETTLDFFVRLDGDRDLEFTSEVNRDNFKIVY